MNRVYRTLKLVVKSACRYNDSIRDHDRNNFGIIRTSITYEITENWNSKKIRISWFRQLGCKLCYIQMCSWAKISYSKRAFSFSKTKTSRLHEICKIFVSRPRKFLVLWKAAAGGSCPASYWQWAENIAIHVTHDT